MGGKNKGIPATQCPDFFPLAGLGEEEAILQDGSLVAVVEVEAADFALLSQEEKEGLIDRYAQVLKGLDFPVDVYVGTKEQELQDYLDSLTNRYQALEGPSRPQGDLFRSCLWQHVRFLEGIVRDHIHSPYVLCAISAGKGVVASGLVRGLRALAPGGAGPSRDSRERDLRALDLQVEKVMEGLKRLGLACRRLGGKKLAREIGGLTRPGIEFQWEPPGDTLVVRGGTDAP